jgi:hypothetical protein
MFRALPGRDGKPPVFRCKECRMIRFRIVPVPRKGEN